MPEYSRRKAIVAVMFGVLAITIGVGSWQLYAQRNPGLARGSAFLSYSAPAGNRPATANTVIDGVSAAVLPNGRLLTPAGVETSVQAPKPFGLALSPDGQMLATLNSGARPFSLTLISALATATPAAKRIDLNASFMGVTFSLDSQRVYLSGGENGNIWIADAVLGKIIGSVNLNGPTHPLDRPLDVVANPARRFKGTFPGNMALSHDGRYLYVVDQGSFKVFVIDVSRIQTGVDAQGDVVEPDNFAAVIAGVSVGRYPYGMMLSPDDKTLFVTHVGIFEYTHLRPESPTGDPNLDYPLCYPGAGYPDETGRSRTIEITKVDPRNLPTSLRDPDGIRCGYVPSDRTYRVPGLGDPNAPQSSSVYVLDVSNPASPRRQKIVKTGPLVGEEVEHNGGGDNEGPGGDDHDRERGRDREGDDSEGELVVYSGSHPNAVVIGRRAVYVTNGNNDSISVLDPESYEERHRIELSPLRGHDRMLRGVQPVGLALSPDGETLYVALAGINAIGVVRLNGNGGRLEGYIPTGWWPSAVRASDDGNTLYVTSAGGRGATPNLVGENNSPKYSVIGTVNIIPTPSRQQLAAYTKRVYANNGFVEERLAHDPTNPIPTQLGKASDQIKHVIFINKENATHDLLLGDITATRGGQPVNGEPSFSLGYDASPNHHELALQFAFSDNFYLEPSVSSDGHRWLTGQYTTEFEETHWPASYGGKRNDSGDDPDVFKNYPGRIGFTDANASPEPNDYNEQGGIYMHLNRYGKKFVNFGNGFEFALIDEPRGVEPTGAREHANVPMEKVVRDNSDHLFPTYNTKIPDAPLTEDPTRFSRFGRFKQVFESQYVDRQKNRCLLPQYVDLYYPNDHGGGATDITNDPAKPWSFTRFVQDNDAALGLTVELLSNSPCWKDTVIFVVEDDTQNGMDHVNGYRSIFLAIGPWVKKQYVSKTHTSLASIFKTANLILGLPPLNQYDAAATDLRDMFTGTPDFTPYTYRNVPFAVGASADWVAMSREVDFSRPDVDEIKLVAAIMKSEGIPRPKPTKP